MAILTLNQIIKGLNDTANAHNQIHSFGFGNVWEMSTSGVTDYVIMWADLEDINRGRTLTEYNFTIYILDRVDRGERNETEVLSDCARITEDVIASLRHPDWTWVVEFNSARVQVFTERSLDMLSGCAFSITIKTINPDDTCQIPTSTLTRF